MAKKTNKTNAYESKTNESVTLDMSNAQEQYVAHWLVRFTGDYVADAIATSNKDSALRGVRTKEEFLNAVTKALNSTFGCSLTAHEYDYGAKKSRSEIIAKLEEKKQKAQADTTKSDLKPFIQAIKDALDSGKVNAENFEPRLKAMCEAHNLSQAQHDTLKAMFPVSAPIEQIVF